MRATKKQQPGTKAKAKPRARREVVGTGEARITRAAGKGRVEFGFGDLERLERRVRAERRAERARRG